MGVAATVGAAPAAATPFRARAAILAIGPPLAVLGVVALAIKRPDAVVAAALF